MIFSAYGGLRTGQATGGKLDGRDCGEGVRDVRGSVEHGSDGCCGRPTIHWRGNGASAAELSEVVESAGEDAVEAGFVTVEEIGVDALLAGERREGRGDAVVARAIEHLVETLIQEAVVDAPETAEAPVSSNHLIDEPLLDGVLRAEASVEGMFERLKVFGRFVVEDQGGGEQSVLDGVAGRTGVCPRRFWDRGIWLRCGARLRVVYRKSA
jgi:hypothetical protein